MIINIKNKADECFKWCVLRALNPKERDSERIPSLKAGPIKFNRS